MEQNITHNIKHEVTNIYSPHMNGVGERFNRSAIEALRATIVDDNLDQVWWAEVLMTYTHVKNRLRQRLLEGQTPYERLFDRKPNIHYFRVIGSKCYRLLPKPQRDSKLGPVSKECILVGVYDPDDDKIYNTEDVRFIETSYADAAKHTIAFGPDDNGDWGNKIINPPIPKPNVTSTLPTTKVIVKDEGQVKSGGNWEWVVKQRPATGRHPNRYDAILSYQGQSFRSAKTVIKYCDENDIDYLTKSVKKSFQYSNPYVGTWNIQDIGDGGQLRILQILILRMNQICRQHPQLIWLI
uniref:Integrase catalytic domain-containing protein n=1 Tax=Strigamia maritima TaxID=126957 RepID=T1IZH4_STRMM